MFANIEINARDLTGFDSEDILNMYLKLQQDKREFVEKYCLDFR
ncbi:hypothetical protein CUPS4256_09125 [Campylobacter upsaliensis]|nr:hypothetical protein [Campylobacter upsaliensis]MCR2103397.1 hypothetical protein [Campylobacter upsaliensis]